MNSTKKTFNNIVDYVKNVQGVKQVGQEKVLAKKSQNMGNLVVLIQSS